MACRAHLKCSFPRLENFFEKLEVDTEGNPAPPVVWGSFISNFIAVPIPLLVKSSVSTVLRRPCFSDVSFFTAYWHRRKGRKFIRTEVKAMDSDNSDQPVPRYSAGICN